jgi:hypothetical protein
MSSSITELEPGKSSQDVYIHLHNISAKDVVIPSNALLCNLQPVACLRTPETHPSDAEDHAFLQLFDLDSN